jgi:ADP-dependent NAD(P)H-hydrate dehydratase / NAD(P)H-hydrate epimerase
VRPWLEPLPDGARMRATDAWAIGEGLVPGPVLMERAGTALARLVEEVAPDGPVAVLAGKGNNGGDGYVVARVLREAGREVRMLAVAPVEELQGDAAHHAARTPSEPWDPRRLAGCAVAVDCLLGTGASGAPRGAALEAVQALDGLRVVACDVPSGVDASTGEVASAAVRAEATCTFHAAKPGLWIAPGKAHAGRVVVADIGIPAGAPVDDPDVWLLRDGVLRDVPRRAASWSKFDSGRVLVAGGSRGLTGAPRLAAEAAMRAGAGYVTVLVPQSAQPSMDAQLVEVMSKGLPEEDGHHTEAGAAEVAARGATVVLGPGLGRTESAVAFGRAVARDWDGPLVLDADGLRAVGLAPRAGETVLTPHEGELGALLDVPSDAIRARRLHHAREAARRAQAVVVLKGDDTLVARPDGVVAVSPGATAALATAGTGDVLAGVAGAMLARGLDAFAAACAAVRLHALAAETVAAEGLIARDVIGALSPVLSQS